MGRITIDKPLIKELSELGLNINVDSELISNLFSNTTEQLNQIDESCENMKNSLSRISNPNDNSSSTSGSMSNLISLITQKIDADTK